MRLIYRTLSGQSYTAEVTEDEARLELRKWRDSWSSPDSIAGVLTFDDAVVRSSAIVAVEAQGLSGSW